MVKHIVMFKLKGTAEERRAVASQFKAALEALPPLDRGGAKSESGRNVGRGSHRSCRQNGGCGGLCQASGACGCGRAAR